MTLPSQIDTETELEDALAEPSDADVECVARLDGDILILGAGGKMGPSLARRVHRAMVDAGNRPAAWSRRRASRRRRARARASRPTASRRSSAISSSPRHIAALPRCPNVLFLAGRKFGTLDRTDLTWATNTVVPARVAEHFVESRLVVFSTGNVYPLVRRRPVRRPTEDDAPAPVGEYAQSCLGRERVVEFVSRERADCARCIFRLNYAVDLRYGTLVDIARRVFAGEPIDLTVGYFNAIWQGDANSYALRSLELCASPPAVAERHRRRAHLRPRDRRVVRLGVRPAAAASSNSGRAGRAAQRFERAAARCSASPPCRSTLLRQWVAHWVRARRARR